MKDQSHLWAADYDEDFADIIKVQDEISRRIASTLKYRLTPEEISVLSSRPIDPLAYEHYLKGTYLHYQYFTSTRLETYLHDAESEFRKALSIEPQYALAIAGLADLYDSHVNTVGTSIVKYTHKRDSLVEIGMKIDPKLWYTLLVKSMQYIEGLDGEKDIADSAFHYLKLAYRAAPNNEKICYTMAGFFMRRGLWRESLPLFEKSAKLDPLNVLYLASQGEVYTQLGMDSMAQKVYKEVIRLDPQAVTGYAGVAISLILENKLSEAEQYLKKAKSISEDHFFTKYAVAFLAASRGDKSVLKDFPWSWLQIRLGLYKEAVDFHAMYPSTYPFPDDNKIYDPLRSRPDFKKLVKELRIKYEVNRKRYEFNEL